MKLTQDQVKHVARLARLALSPSEAEQYRVQLSAVLDAVDELKQLDTSQVPPTSGGLLGGVETEGAGQRADEVGAQLQADEVFANAPRREGHSFSIPKVIE